MKTAQDESRHDKFRRLATARAERVADEIRKIGNLGSSNYEYTREDVEKLFAYIEERLTEARARFSRYRSRRVPPLEL